MAKGVRLKNHTIIRYCPNTKGQFTVSDIAVNNSPPSRIDSLEKLSSVLGINDRP